MAVGSWNERVWKGVRYEFLGVLIDIWFSNLPDELDTFLNSLANECLFHALVSFSSNLWEKKFAGNDLVLITMVG